MSNKKCLSAVLFLVYNLYLVSSASIGYNKLFQLDIVHFNDFHARFEETTVDFPVCESNDTNCLGGFSRLYHEINTLLLDKPDALVLNAGDSFQGTYWYSLLKWNVTQMFINLLPIDAHAIGNHEFDDGVPGLAPYLASLRAPIVAANVDISGEPKLDGLLQSSIIVERHGREIGIIGLITVDTATGSNPGNVIFLDPIETTKREAALLADKGVDIIILLSHCGLEIDKEIAEKVGQHVDVIVGGHSHSLLWNGTAPSHEEVSGPYPILIEREDQHKVLVVTASAFTKYLGNITVYFNEDGELRGYEGQPVFLNRSIPEDPEVNAMLQPFTEELHKLVQTEIGQTKDELNMESCGQEECAFGNLVANAFRDRALQKNISNLPHLAFVLRNSIRGSLPQGSISRGALINAFPFKNHLSTFIIEGQYIVEALEHTMSSYWTKEPFTSPWLPHVAGMRVVLNPADEKVVSVGIKHDEDYRELEPRALYQVVTFDFISEGRSGFTMLKNHAKNVTDIGVDRLILEEYIKKESPIRPRALLDNRLIIVN